MGTDALENNEDMNLDQQNAPMGNEESMDGMTDGPDDELSADEDIDGIEDADEEDDHSDSLAERKPSDNAITLLKQAIKHLEDDNSRTAFNEIKLAVKYLKGKAQIEDVEPETDDKLYGECRNFGVIYNIMESNSVELYKSAKGRQALKEFVNLIKNNKVLNEQYNYYSLYTDKRNRYDNLSEYIHEAVSYAPSVSKNTLKKENQKLINALRNAQVNEMVDINDEDMSLYEAIEATIHAKSSSRHINEMVNAKVKLKDCLSAKPKVEETKRITYKEYEKAVEDAVKEISEGISEDEFKLLREMQDPKCDKKAKFNYYKQDTLKMISHAMNEETDTDNKSRLSKIYIQINEQQYNENNALLDVAKFISVKNILN